MVGSDDALDEHQLYVDALDAAGIEVVEDTIVIGGGGDLLALSSEMATLTEVWVASEAEAVLATVSLLSQALLIGFVQCIAIWPGTSRSMTTIVGGMIAGLRPRDAAEFSFLLGLPTLGAACGYRLVGDVLGEGPNMLEVLGAGPIVVGTIVAMISAALAIKWLVGYLTRRFPSQPESIAVRVVRPESALGAEYLAALGAVHWSERDRARLLSLSARHVRGFVRSSADKEELYSARLRALEMIRGLPSEENLEMLAQVRGERRLNLSANQRAVRKAASDSYAVMKRTLQDKKG